MKKVHAGSPRKGKLQADGEKSVCAASTAVFWAVCALYVRMYSPVK